MDKKIAVRIILKLIAMLASIIVIFGIIITFPEIFIIVLRFIVFIFVIYTIILLCILEFIHMYNKEAKKIEKSPVSNKKLLAIESIGKNFWS